jgi:hypothetical protein
MMSDSIDSVLRMECLAVRHGYISLRPSIKACTNRSLCVLYIMLKFQYEIYALVIFKTSGLLTISSVDPWPTCLYRELFTIDICSRAGPYSDLSVRVSFKLLIIQNLLLEHYMH